MRLIVIAVLVVLALWVLIAGLRNSRRVSFFGIFVFLIPAGGLGYFEYQYQESLTQISEAVQEVSTNDDAVLSCQRASLTLFDAAAAETELKATADPQIELNFRECMHLRAWAGQENLNLFSDDQVESVHLLARETMRVGGSVSDSDPSRAALLECLAVKNTPQLVAVLGGSEEAGEYAAYRYLSALQEPAVKRAAVYC